MLTCTACGAHVRDGYLCRDCVDELRDAFAELAPGRTHLPSYALGPAGRTRSLVWDLPAAAMIGGLAAHLEITATRQARIGTSTRGATDDRPPPFDPRAAALRAALVRTCAPWAAWALDLERPAIDPPTCRHRSPVGADCPACADAPARHSARWAAWHRWRAAVDVGDLATLAAYLGRRVHVLAAREEAGYLHAAVVPTIERVLTAVDRPADAEFVGYCATMRDGDPCASPLYCEPGAVFVTCLVCGEAWSVTGLQADLLKATEDHLDTAARIATALTRLERPVTAERIRKWKQRGRLVERPAGSKLYRVGDVLDLLAEHDRKATA